MAYDLALADRVRAALAREKGVTEKAMFGGVAFLIGGHMALGVAKEELMVRVGPGGHEAALALPHTRPMDFTGRPMRGMLFVRPDGARSVSDVKGWAARALAFARTLPPKEAAKPPKKPAKQKPPRKKPVAARARRRP
jgi:hypothetical protein